MAVPLADIKSHHVIDNVLAVRDAQPSSTGTASLSFLASALAPCSARALVRAI